MAKKEKTGVWEYAADKYKKAAKSGMLGDKAKVAAEENEKKKKKKEQK